MMTLGMLAWRPHISPVLSGFLVAVLVGWVWYMYRSLCSRMTKRRAITLVIPRVAVVALLLVALLDPLWSRNVSIATRNKVLAVVDVSSSMDVKDDGKASRLTRAAAVLDRLSKDLPSEMKLRRMEFDTELREFSGRPGRDRESGRTYSTDLGGTLLALARRADLSSHAAVILITDGGDEPVDSVELPVVPLYVVGTGRDLNECGDLALTDVQYPSTVEKNSTFEIAVDAVRRKKGALAGRAMSKVGVRLDREEDERWVPDSRQTVNLENGWARVTFKTSCEIPGLQKFRVSIQEIPGEVSFFNNSRTIGVDVRKKSLHVLFFARELGSELKMLRSELVRDPGVTFNALYRTMGERFTMQGPKFPDDEKLEGGFPADQETLRHFDCIIIGDVPVEDWSEKQVEALKEYVENGGALVFLGNDIAFGADNRVSKMLEELMPWEPGGTGMLLGRYPVSIPLGSLNHPIVAGISQLLTKAGGAAAESVCRTGPAKQGATQLMTIVVDRRSVPLVAIQRYGKGNILAIASNTMWKWARESAALQDAYGLFWRQAVRNLAVGVEGGQVLSVKWDKQAYKPGEKAMAEIRAALPDAGRAIQFTAAFSGSGTVKQVPVEPMQGEDREYCVKYVFEKKGMYHFTLSARQGGSLIESYEKDFPVGALAGEGTHLELDAASLRRLAERGGGKYFSENEVDKLAADLAAKHLTKDVMSETSLLSDAPWFAVVFLMVLVTEWVLRRRRNLF